MNLYKISQDDNNDYDTYDSAIVAAKSASAAAKIHPSGYETSKKDYLGMRMWSDKVDVEYIGKAAKGIKAGTILCASFNAG